MALNSDLIKFFIDLISKSEMRSFGSVVAQLFQHLKTEVKDNPIFNEYEKGIEDDDHFQSDQIVNWSIPVDFEKAKAYAYSAYRAVAGLGSLGYEIPVMMIGGRGDINSTIEEFNEILLEYFSKALEDIVNANPEISTDEIQKVGGHTVFIIHGHDNELKTELQLLLHRAGVRNVVLHERPDKGRTIIDKLVEESKDSNYAIALFSPDDILIDGISRARQNVILEAGYFMGKLGKERVRMIIKGKVEIPTDLQGILYEKYDGAGAWKIKILKELQAVGIFVDIKSVIENI